LTRAAYVVDTGQAGNTLSIHPRLRPLNTADISIQLLMDTTNALQEIESRMTARAFGAVHNPEQGPAVRKTLEELL